MKKPRFERIIETYPDRCFEEIRISFILKSKVASVVLDIYLKIQQTPDFKNKHLTFSDLSWHSFKKRPDLFKVDPCYLSPKEKCWFAASTLIPKEDEAIKNYFAHGEKWIWKYLEEKYNQVFNEKEK